MLFTYELGTFSGNNNRAFGKKAIKNPAQRQEAGGTYEREKQRLFAGSLFSKQRGRTDIASQCPSTHSFQGPPLRPRPVLLEKATCRGKQAKAEKRLERTPN